MIPLPPDPLGTPPHAPFENLSPLPRNSMADADSSVKRKRPRLDSGERAYRSMSAEPPKPAAVPPNNSDFNVPSEMNSQHQTAQEVTQATKAATQPMKRSSSQFTINVKVPNSAELVDQVKRAEEEKTSQEEASPTLAQMRLSDDPDISAEAAGSSPLSSDGSPPVIEVAELEDVHGHIGPTVWHRADASGTVKWDDQSSLIDFFPYLTSHGSQVRAIEQLGQQLQHDEIDGSVLGQIGEWMDNFLSSTSDRLNDWFEVISQHRDFWELLPILLEQLSLRRLDTSDFHAFYSQGLVVLRSHLGPLQKFLVAFARLTARMINADNQTIRETMEDSNSNPDLIGTIYIRAFRLITAPQSHFVRVQEAYGWPINPVLATAIEALISDLKAGMDSLTHQLILLMGKAPFDIDTASNLVEFLKTLALSFVRFLDEEVSESSEGLISSEHQRGIWRLFVAADQKLQEMVSKQSSILNLESLRWIIDSLTFILQHVLIGFHDIDTTGVSSFVCDFDVSSLVPWDRMMLLLSRWKMQLLKRCIMQGRMDSRALGVELMSEHLVEIFLKYLKHRDSDLHHVVPTFHADFIQQNTLLEYLLGVESHTQLVGRSKNIIGFLIVSKRYTEKETDIIWNSILTSQDPRLLEAILLMVSGVLELFTDPAPLCHWYWKLDALPFRYFESTQMRSFLQSLAVCLVKVRPEHELDRPFPSCHSLYIHLICEAYVEQNLPLKKRKEILGFAMEQFRAYVPRLTEPDKDMIYQQCAKTIGETPRLATGSIAVMNVMLEYSNQFGRRDAELQSLESKFNLTSAVVHDLLNLELFMASLQISVHDFSEILTDRLKLVQKIILGLSGSLTHDLTKDIWASLVGERALDDQCRDMAWQSLSKATESCRGRTNSFFEQVLDEHFPRLESRYFTASVYEFAKAATEYEKASARLNNDIDHNQHNNRAGELFWPISLKAAQPELGNKAINNLVDAQLRSQEHQSQDPDQALEAHSAFVAQAIRYLIAASNVIHQAKMDRKSSNEDDTMMEDIPGIDITAAKLQFLRSLSILHKFVQQIRNYHSGSPVSGMTITEQSKPLKGKEVLVQFQGHVGGKPTAIRKLLIGDQSTFGELLDRFRDATGFSEFNIYSYGQKIGQGIDPDTALHELPVFQRSGLFVLQSKPGQKIHNYGKSLSLHRVESEIMKHFSVLYQLLAIEDELGAAVFRFLSLFPPHEDIRSLVYDISATVSQVFPPGALYKSMYSVHVLQSTMEQYLSQGEAPPDLLVRAVNVLVTALTAIKVPINAKFENPVMTLANSFVEALLKVLRERVTSDVSALYFTQPDLFISHLHNIIDTAILDPGNLQAGSLINQSFAVMLEASTHCDQVWSLLVIHCSTKNLLQTILLDCPDQVVRASTSSTVKSYLAAIYLFESLDQQVVEKFFWSLLSNLIPIGAEAKQNSEPFFNCLLDTFRALTDTTKAGLPLQLYIREWSRLLINHNHTEFVGRNTIDPVVYGLTVPLEWCLRLVLYEKKAVDIPEYLAKDIFDHLLFPEPCYNLTTENLEDAMAVLDSKTRQCLYSLVLDAAHDIASYITLIASAKRVTPQLNHSNAWAWGFAQINDDQGFTYNNPWDIDRNYNVRSDTGYAGLKNLQNTCYMNSLLTQLFMNIEFRDFFLRLHVTDPNGSQKLLSETQKLLAYMQETWLRAVDPDNVTDVLVTYEGTPIDVSIQMDVDEFYNLLFDRWESQIPSEADKKAFRSFYGGEIVQQIKSKDCPHVSERLETFSAIQCDIQGKPNLTESLRAYVDGEMMEGDNKYSCSACGSYVNAMKRSCFKTIPNHLIFHLKRFDYDLMNGTRNKINERFEFPEHIDMAPYHIDNIQSSNKMYTADTFTLVGVLIHSGSAEAGHYYSYIRERPYNLENWLEFNDSDVTYYNPANIENSCFGGWQEQFHYNTMAFPRTWNAYMLFYQRSSTLSSLKSASGYEWNSMPARASIPPSLQTRIGLENRRFVKMFCLFDPEYAKFVKGLLEKYFHLFEDTCSSNHELESTLMNYVLEHLFRVFAREKDCKDIRLLFELTTRLITKCPNCCKCFFTWLTSHVQDFKIFLLRCPYESLRHQFSLMVIQGLHYLKDHDPDKYGLLPELHELGDNPRSLGEDGVIIEIVLLLRDLQPNLASSNKYWDDYFDLVYHIASMGRFESFVLHHYGFLSYCLEILVVARSKIALKFLPQHQVFARNLEKRTFSFFKLVDSLDVLLRNAIIQEKTNIQSTNVSAAQRSTYVLTDGEFQLLTYHEPRTKAPITFLDEILFSTGENTASCKNIIRTFTREFAGSVYHDSLHHTIARARKLPNHISLMPYVNGALAYCDTCPLPSHAEKVFAHYSQAMDVDDHGLEYLDFFRSFYRLYNPNLDQSFFKILTIRVIGDFAPRFLVSRDIKVRKAMLAFTQNACFPDIVTTDSELSTELCNQASAKTALSCVSYLERLVRQQETINASRVTEMELFLREYAADYLVPCEFGSMSIDVSDFRNRIHGVLERLETITMSSPEEMLSNLEYGSEEEYTDNSNPNDVA